MAKTLANIPGFCEMFWEFTKIMNTRSTTWILNWCLLGCWLWNNGKMRNYSRAWKTLQTRRFTRKKRLRYNREQAHRNFARLDRCNIMLQIALGKFCPFAKPTPAGWVPPGWDSSWLRPGGRGARALRSLARRRPARGSARPPKIKILKYVDKLSRSKRCKKIYLKSEPAKWVLFFEKRFRHIPEQASERYIHTSQYQNSRSL